MEMFVMCQPVNVANVSLDSLETSVNDSAASVAIVQTKQRVRRQLVYAVYVNPDSLETSVNHSASVATVQMKQHVRRQLVNVANVSLDSLETSAKCANVAIVKMKLFVMCQLVNVTYVNPDLVDTSAQVNKDFLWKQGPLQLLQDTSVNFSPMLPKFVPNYPHKVKKPRNYSSSIIFVIDIMKRSSVVKNCVNYKKTMLLVVWFGLHWKLLILQLIAPEKK